MTQMPRTKTAQQKTARKHDEKPSASELTPPKLAAGQKLTAGQIRERMKLSPFIQLLRIRLTRLQADGVTLECPTGPDLYNVIGTLHGGVTATMADTAAGFAIARELGGIKAITTVDLKINYFRPVTGGKLFARARVIRTGRTLCVAAVDLSDDQKRAIATALVTYIQITHPA
jgi:uncharacterized protein (TIGR00369 family)